MTVDTGTTQFTLQGRTDRAVTQNGTVTDATIFSAFAATDNSNASLQVELKENKQGLYSIIRLFKSILSCTFYFLFPKWYIFLFFIVDISLNYSLRFVYFERFRR